ncbi:hypothetical protein LDENG_00241130, partial [Lucifuga dentata]
MLCVSCQATCVHSVNLDPSASCQFVSSPIRFVAVATLCVLLTRFIFVLAFLFFMCVLFPYSVCLYIFANKTCYYFMETLCFGL